MAASASPLWRGVSVVLRSARKRTMTARYSVFMTTTVAERCSALELSIEDIGDGTTLSLAYSTAEGRRRCRTQLGGTSKMSEATHRACERASLATHDELLASIRPRRNVVVGNVSSYEAGMVWGQKYFKGNYKRLSLAKGRVDPDDYFRNE